ncbi:MAG TPA: hypothetical protein VKV23_04890 [Acidimicrobiales bacterium]|jgi:hypothetical protein|nr:hypothetical protein [Acidimicrobiales bacterium]
MQDNGRSGIDILDEAIDELLGRFADQAVSVSRVINPLLDIWSLARDVHPEVAAPVERLLVALNRRTLTSAKELAATLEEVRAAARRQNLAAV